MSKIQEQLESMPDSKYTCEKIIVIKEPVTFDDIIMANLFPQYCNSPLKKIREINFDYGESSTIWDAYCCPKCHDIQLKLNIDRENKS